MMNPFVLGNILPGEPFCNRKKEIDELVTYATNSSSVVIFSPRRYGKTSLVRQVMAAVEKKKFLTVYVDLFSVSSMDDFIQKFTAGIIKAIGKDVAAGSFIDKVKRLFGRLIPSIDIRPDGGIGISVKYDTDMNLSYLIEDIFSGLAKHISSKKIKALIVFDEFQEITGLAESKKIEGTLREFIQSQRNMAFFFVGSRRTVLQAMFTDSQRPFFKSAFSYPIDSINKNDLVRYVIGQFQKTGKKCPQHLSEKLYDYVDGNTYYVQKSSHLLWDLTKKTATEDLLNKAKMRLMESESISFQSIFGGLNTSEKKLIKALSSEPTMQPYAGRFLAKHGLSLGGVQKSISSLIKKDLIELYHNGQYKVIDELFAQWCRAS